MEFFKSEFETSWKFFESLQHILENLGKNIVVSGCICFTCMRMNFVSFDLFFVNVEFCSKMSRGPSLKAIFSLVFSFFCA